ncbi:FMRFamide receptor-like [Gigantopelta aegis]|uniref:FMRFamide receptor-like n=1 Tax=Gigantopelta aegis TaxID=1735272 RepID=UPI001B88CC4B|nr:FMRFamide receptor-like [Gigantopelta aegis]
MLLPHFELYPQNYFPFLIPPLKQCLTPHPLCDNGLEPANATAYWMEITDYFSFLALPVILSFAFVTEVISIIVLSKQIRMSLDTYLLGLSMATILLILCTVILGLQHYTGYQEFLVYIQGYVISCRDWFWYTTIWLMVMMSFERALTVSSSRQNTLCSSGQAGVVVVMVFCVGLVSALPRFWEYTATEVRNLATNETVLLAIKTHSTTTPEYNTMYFWYVKTITLFLPYLMMLGISITLSCKTRRSTMTRQYMAVKHSSGLTLNRKIKEEIALSKLLILLIIVYVLFTTPFCLLDLLSYVLPHWISSDTRIFASLHNLFSVFFFLHNAFHLILYFCYNKQFRLTLLSLCCCCC